MTNEGLPSRHRGIIVAASRRRGVALASRGRKSIWYGDGNVSARVLAPPRAAVPRGTTVTVPHPLPLPGDWWCSTFHDVDVVAAVVFVEGQLRVGPPVVFA